MSYPEDFLPISCVPQSIILRGWYSEKGYAMLYPDDGLTMREREMVLLIARGMVVKEIARRLNVSEKTVRNHLSSIYRKLAVYDRSQVVIYALKKGLIDLHSL
jgi:DNA-binding NarL/FixJ family response regulator